MLTETISGKCPICSYDKLRQRYGSMGHYQIDGCPSCGMGCGGSDFDTKSGTESWIEISAIDLTYKYSSYIEKEFNSDPGLVKDNCFDCIFGEVKDALMKMPQDELRYLIFESHEAEGRFDDVETTVWTYSQEDLAEYIIINKPVIFNSNGQQHSRIKDDLRKKTRDKKDALCQLVRRAWDWQKCPTSTGLRSTKDLGCGCHDVNGNCQASRI
jgi:hypothetical protein